MHPGDKGLFETFELRGKWWLPDSPEDQVHGVVSYSAAGPIKLRLDGRFGAAESQDPSEFLQNPYPLLNRLKAECIVGETVDEEACTLYRGFPSHLSSTQTYTANGLIVGKRFNKVSEISVSGALVGYTNLEEWCSTAILKQEPGSDPGHFRIAVPTSPTSVFTVCDAARVRKLELLVQAQCSFVAGSFSAQTRAYFDIQFEDSLQLQEAEGLMGQLANLLTVLQGRPTHATMIRLKLAGSETPQNAVNLFRVPRTQSAPPVLAPEMDLPYTEISDYTSKIFRSWFINESLDPVYDLVVSTIYNTRQSVYTNFLALMQAVETLHRRLYGGEYLADSPFQPIRDALCSAIPADLEEDFKQRLESAIKYGNQLSLRTRLKALLRTLSDRTKQSILGEEEKDFVHLTVRTRNYLTHYDEADRPPIIDDVHRMYNLNVRVRALLTILLLIHLGAAEDKVATGLAQHLSLAR